MKKVLILLAFLSLAVLGQDFRQNARASLFSDYKAIGIGDAVTIVITESTQASNNAKTSHGRGGQIGFDFSGAMDETNLPSANFGLNTNNEFEGGGSTKTEGMVKARISATIDSVLDNGNLRISGTQKISINEEEQIIEVSGIIRPSDVRPDNSVYSYNLSNAEISIQNDGAIGRNTSPGWLTKLFHWLF